VTRYILQVDSTARISNNALQRPGRATSGRQQALARCTRQALVFSYALPLPSCSAALWRRDVFKTSAVAMFRYRRGSGGVFASPLFRSSWRQPTRPNTGRPVGRWCSAIDGYRSDQARCGSSGAAIILPADQRRWRRPAIAIPVGGCAYVVGAEQANYS